MIEIPDNPPQELKNKLNEAMRPDTSPHRLYELAQDRHELVRLVVAQNKATPMNANTVLAEDEHEDVRIGLTEKITDDILKKESNGDRSLSDALLKILDILVQDSVGAVRTALSTPLQASKLIPKTIVKRLAADPDPAVSGPMLDHSPQLMEGDFVELLHASPSPHLAAAVRARPDLSEEILDVVEVTCTNTSATIYEFTPPSTYDAETIHNAILGGQRAFVFEALAKCSGRSISFVQKSFEAQSTKTIICLCYMSNLSASAAFQAQLRLAHIAPMKAIAPKDGTYPFSEEDMMAHLDLMDGIISDT